VIVFHVLLMLFGFGVWLWSVPAVAALVLLARRDTSTMWAERTPPALNSGGQSR
jgi:hypothetical protein